MSTIALIINYSRGAPHLVDFLLEDREIESIDLAVQAGAENPLKKIYEKRMDQKNQNEAFEDYIEYLLTQPLTSIDTKKHCFKWLSCRTKIESYLKKEQDAARAIAEYAYQVFLSDPEKTDFFLVSPTHKVRIRVFLGNL